MKYIENINYRITNTKTMEDELKELKRVLLKRNVLYEQDFDLYNEIKDLVLNEIKTEEMAITKITGYFEQLVNNQEYDKLKMILHFINNNNQSYQKMADNLGIKRNNFHRKIQIYAKEEIWLMNLFKIKGMLDRRRKSYSKKGNVDEENNRDMVEK